MTFSVKLWPCISVLLLAGCLYSSDFEAESFNVPESATLEASEIFRISSPAEGSFFSSIRKVHLLSDGNLVVQNYPDHQLYELTPDGELVGVIGRQGRGPGEFIETFISHLANDDSLHVFDFNNSRHQVLTRAEPGQWNYARESDFRRRVRQGLRVQIPDHLLSGEGDEMFGLFRIHPGSRDTLQAQYMYVSNVDLNLEHDGDIDRLRLVSDLALYRGENLSRVVHNNPRFYSGFYNFNPVTDEVILVHNTSNEIIAIDSSDNESVIGYLPFERFPVNHDRVDQSLVHVNYHYSGMEQIVRSKLLEHEPYYWNVILHENRLWVNLARTDSNSPNWVITNLEGQVQEAFHGPDRISEVTIQGKRMYGSVRDEDAVVYLVGNELTEKK